MNRPSNLAFFLLMVSLLIFSSCRSVDEIVVDKISKMMSSDEGSGAFVRDDDPQLVADALPFVLKMYEMLMEMNPDDAGLKLAAGKSFIMYANAFIQTPAGMLPDDEWENQEIMLSRARNMYLRGRDYVAAGLALELDLPSDPLQEDPEVILEQTDPELAPYLYWAGAAWLGAFSCNPFDMELGSGIYKPVAYLFFALKMDENLENGGIHDLLITVWSSIPGGIIDKAFLSTPDTAGAFSAVYYKTAGVGNSPEERALYHMERSVALSEGNNPSPYVSYATGIPVMKQDYETFESLLNKALAIDPSGDPDNELVTVIIQDKARWYLDHREDFFLMDF